MMNNFYNVQTGQNALMWAARFDKVDIMNYLVEETSDVNATDIVSHNNLK